jgi:GDP-4-dehydro-6-deoxy-D-mannose reductase
MPIKEDSLVNPVSPYALSKAMQNECCRSYALLYNVDVVITRSFNHTGPGQTDTFVLGSFARQIAEIEQGLQDPIIEIGNLDVRRDFLDVRDVGEAYIALLGKGKRGNVYNVCSGKAYSLSDLLDRLCQIAKLDVELRVAKERLRPVDTPELRGDPTKIRTDTGWQPRIPIEETLRALLDHWRESVGSIKGGQVG